MSDQGNNRAARTHRATTVLTALVIAIVALIATVPATAPPVVAWLLAVTLVWRR